MNTGFRKVCSPSLPASLQPDSVWCGVTGNAGARLTAARTQLQRLGGAALVAALAGGLMLGGCDQRSETAREVDRISAEVQTASGSGRTKPPAGSHLKTLQKAETETQKVAKSGSESDQGAASLLLATSQYGLASEPLTRAIEADVTARKLISQINAENARWTKHQSDAAAARSFDPQSQIEDIQKLLAGKKASLKTDQDKLTVVQTKVESLRAQAKQRLDAGAAKLSEYATLSAQAVKVSASEGAPIVAQANVIRREGDALKLEGSKIEAEADSISPEIGELRLQIEQLANQSNDLEASLQEVAARKRALDAEAQAADQAATVTANQLDKLVGDVETLYDKDLKEAYESAVSAFSKAKSSASSARQTAGVSSKLLAGEAELAIASALWDKSQAMSNFATCLEGLVNTKPPLPQATKYAQKATELRKLQNEALKEANEAFAGARSSIASPPGSNDEVKQRIERLSTLLEGAGKVTGDERADVVATFGLTPRTPIPNARANSAESATGAPGAVIPVDPEVLAVVDRYVAAVVAGTPLDEFIVGDASLIAMSNAGAKLDAAMRSKMSISLATAMGPMGRGSTNTSLLEGKTSADATIVMNSETSAVATFEGVPPFPFDKVDGRWVMNLDKVMEGAGPVKMMAPMLIKAFEELTADVESGKLSDPAAVGPALQQKIMAAMGGK